MHRASLFSFLPSFLCFGLIGVATGLAPALVAEETFPAPGPVVELPKFVVTDNRELPPPESWRYATIPGFEILSNASDRATSRLMKDFQLFRLGLNEVWPIPSRPAHPISLIIAGKGAKFDAFIPNGKDAGPEMARASLFLKHGDRTAIVIDFESSVLNILSSSADDAGSGTDSNLLSVDHDKQLYREYVRYLLSQSEPRLPAWFEEGMTQIIIGMKVTPKLIEFGKIEDPNLISAAAGQVAQLNALTAVDDPDNPTLPGAPAEDRDFNAALQRRPLMSLPRMFAVSYDAPEAVNPLGNNVWAKQCYAFVHMCLYGRGGRYAKAFSTFLIRCTREPVTEAMFKECFTVPKESLFGLNKGQTKEMSFNDMLMELRGYINTTDYIAHEYRAKKGEPGIPIPPPLVLRDATQSEVGRIKGEAFILAGHNDKARTEFIAPYIRGERDPQLLASLGLYDKLVGEDARARKFLEAAVANKTTTPEAYIELGRYRYVEAMAKPAASDGMLSPAQTASIVDPLIVGRRQPPMMYQTYELLGDVWLRSEQPRKKEEIAVLLDGLQTFPGRMKLAYQTALLASQAGDNAIALMLANHGLKYAPDAPTKARFQRLKDGLPDAAVTDQKPKKE